VATPQLSGPDPEPSDPATVVDGDGSTSSVDWSELPAPVATRLVEIASDALTTLVPVDVPAPLRPVAKFAPAKRARLAANVLLSALREYPSFRAAVLLWAKEHRPDAVDPNAANPARAAAAATLLGCADAAELIAVVARQTDLERLREERDAALVKVERLAIEVERLRGELAEAMVAVDKVRGEGESELERLRGRLREQGVRVRRATQDSAAATAALARANENAETAMAALRAERDRERDRAEAERRRADRAVADAEVARQAAREARAADEVRLSLLVDTLAGAVTGLRRELALGSRERGEANAGPGGPRPADLVRGASRPEGSPGRVEDPAALDRLLALPSVHLVVDGYNVTKTGYPELPLSGQRDRLVMQLSALAARTSAEVTVVFDGAGVVAVPTTAPRGVRVLFSDPGVLADDVIRAVVAAEPEGRPVVVVTSDRAVADSVRRRGAHPVPSAVLLARLTRV
jgi:predicted RNA-binding protein with PIN domain